MDSIKGRTSIENPPKIKSFSSSKQLEFHVANVYSEISEMVNQKDDLEIQMPAQVPTAVERVNLIKSVLAYLLQERKNCHPVSEKQDKQERQEQNGELEEKSCIFECKDCENYQKNLQKLEGEVRNHIRTHQQLKLYQDGLQQKIDQSKKEKKQLEKKYQNLKRKYEELKSNVSVHTERMTKYETQNEKLKSELKNYRSGMKQSHDEPAPKRLHRYESNKENLNDWRNHNNQQSKNERTSVDRRNESSERMRVSVNVKSSKGIPLSSKIIQDKHIREDHTHKQKQKNIIKNRIGFGY